MPGSSLSRIQPDSSDPTRSYDEAKSLARRSGPLQVGTVTGCIAKPRVAQVPVAPFQYQVGSLLVLYPIPSSPSPVLPAQQPSSFARIGTPRPVAHPGWNRSIAGSAGWRNPFWGKMCEKEKQIKLCSSAQSCRASFV